MVQIIEAKTYFFLTKSVFDVASRNTSNSSSKFLLNSVLIKITHRDKINPHIVFFLLDEVDNIKNEYGDKFEALLEIGENMFYPEYNPKIKGNINERILSYATDKDGEITEKDVVKIVCADTFTEQFFKDKIREHSYPVEAINIDSALEEMSKINQELNKGNCYVIKKTD